MGHEERQNRELTERERERYRKLTGEIRRAGCFNQDGCPKCGVKNQMTKKFCYGIEPDLRKVLFGFPECPLIGPHLHGECAVCGFVWFERTQDDLADLPGRGGLRFDEMLDETGG